MSDEKRIRRKLTASKMGVLLEDEVTTTTTLDNSNSKALYLRSSCGSTEELHLEDDDYESQQSVEEGGEEESMVSIQRGMLSVGESSSSSDDHDEDESRDIITYPEPPLPHKSVLFDVELHDENDNQSPSKNYDDDAEAASSSESLLDEQEEEEANKQFMGPYTRHEYTFAISAGSVLAFNSGYVNGSCLSGFIAPSGRKQATASLTGTTSKSALALADGNYQDFGFLFGMVFSFMCGACISGLMTPRPTKFRIMPTYGPTFLLGAIFLIVSSTLAALEVRQENLVFFLAAAANGIQNGISSSYSGNLIRSTGYTGAITDITIVLAQMSQGNSENSWKLGVLVTLLGSFWLGGIVSYWSALHLQHLSLLINAGIFVLIGGSLVAFLVIELGISIQEAVLGTWNWQKAINKLHNAFLDTSIFLCSADVHGSRTTYQSSSQQPPNQRGGEGLGSSCPSSGRSTTTLGELTDRQLNGIFSRLDTDHSNTLDEGKLFIALQNAGMSVSRRECRIMMSHASLSGDGTITRTEWIQIVRSTRQKRMSDFSIFSSLGSMRSMRTGNS